MNYEDIRKWCHGEMRALADSPMHARGRAIELHEEGNNK